jgi:fructokinase
MRASPLQAGFYGAVEAGGTKVNVAVGLGPTDIVDSARVDTTTPEITIAAMLEFFEPHRANLQSFGVASFGPVRIDRAASDWGTLLATPKRGWAGASFVHPLAERFGLPIGLDTDVNAAVLAEHQLGALQGFSSGAYITVGTGIGGGLIADGTTIHGVMHPEIGHIRVLRLLEGDHGFAGCCPYHGDCLEGLAAGPAIEQRWGASLNQLPQDHIAHKLIADYIGQACATLALTFSTGRIVVGGGVSHSPGLHTAIAARMRHWLGGYLTGNDINADAFIVAPCLGDRAGLIGAMLLAMGAVRHP